MLASISRNVISASGFVERYVLSLVYLFFAWREFHTLALLSAGQPAWAGTGGAGFAPAAQHMTLFLLQLLVGVLLLLSRRPAGQPRSLKELLVPLAASFFFLAYNFLPLFPAPLQENLLPLPMQTPFALAALVLGVAGPAISVCGVLYLGRSLGIFVSVREIVLRGPYRHVRHPIYLGYFCIWIGLVLLNFSVAIFVIVSVHSLLMIARARLEESRLAEHSAEYREYMKRTGFIFPRF